jgi:hypothetical protein
MGKELTTMMFQARIFAPLIAFAAAVLPLAAPAQETGATAGAAPSYAHADESVRGHVTSFDGAYALQVRDDRGFIDNVQLHPGTIINPTGIRLVPGMPVTIYGATRGNVFAANEIDTPYHTEYAYAYPMYAYPYPVYAYPYPVYPFSVGIRIGPRFHGGFHRRFR